MLLFCKTLIVIVVMCLGACGGGSTGVDTNNSIGKPVVDLPSGLDANWKISWGDGIKSARVYDPVTMVQISESTWNVSAVFQVLLAEVSSGTMIIDEGPNKGQSTNLRWKGTTIPYDNRYHPLTCAMCRATGGGWSGFGSTGSYAIYEDENGVGRIYEGHLISRPGMNVVSMHTVPDIVAPANCGVSPVWYTAYYDRGGIGPGTVANSVN